MFGAEESSTFRTSVRIYHDENLEGIEVENFLDFGASSITDLDISFGIGTDIKNLDDRGRPYFFTDMVTLEFLIGFYVFTLIEGTSIEGTSIEGTSIEGTSIYSYIDL